MDSWLGVDPTRAVPIFRQIEDGVRRLVASGRLSSGRAVPSVRELSRDLGVNPATVAKAYRRLTDAGVLTVRRGEGTFVAERPPAEVDAERCRLLERGAREYVGLARSVGVDRRGALEMVERVWDQGPEQEERDAD